MRLVSCTLLAFSLLVGCQGDLDEVDSTEAPLALSDTLGIAGHYSRGLGRWVRRNPGYVRVDGTPGDDQVRVHGGLLELTRGTDGVVETHPLASGILLGLGHGDDLVELSGEPGAFAIVGGDGNDRLFGGTGDTVLVGGAGDDELELGDGGGSVYGMAGDDTIRGGAGADRLVGGAGHDAIRGGAGDDELRGDDGADTLDGGDGDDLLAGLAGRDRMHGGRGDDELSGGRDADTISGGDGADLIDAGPGNDDVSGGAGNDEISGDSGDDVIIGGYGNDDIEGDTGDDRLRGGPGNDRVIGGWGDDQLLGDGGNDLLCGSAGADRLTGGTGADRIGGNAGRDVIITGEGRMEGRDIVVEDGSRDFARDPNADTEAHYERIDIVSFGYSPGSRHECDPEDTPEPSASTDAGDAGDADAGTPSSGETPSDAGADPGHEPPHPGPGPAPGASDAGPDAGDAEAGTPNPGDDPGHDPGGGSPPPRDPPEEPFDPTVCSMWDETAPVSPPTFGVSLDYDVPATRAMCRALPGPVGGGQLGFSGSLSYSHDEYRDHCNDVTTRELSGSIDVSVCGLDASLSVTGSSEIEVERCQECSSPPVWSCSEGAVCTNVERYLDIRPRVSRSFSIGFPRGDPVFELTGTLGLIGRLRLLEARVDDGPVECTSDRCEDPCQALQATVGLGFFGSLSGRIKIGNDFIGASASASLRGEAGVHGTVTILTRGDSCQGMEPEVDLDTYGEVCLAWSVTGHLGPFEGSESGNHCF